MFSYYDRVSLYYVICRFNYENPALLTNSIQNPEVNSQTSCITTNRTLNIDTTIGNLDEVGQTKNARPWFESVRREVKGRASFPFASHASHYALINRRGEDYIHFLAFPIFLFRLLFYKTVSAPVLQKRGEWALICELNPWNWFRMRERLCDLYRSNWYERKPGYDFLDFFFIYL